VPAAPLDALREAGLDRRVLSASAGATLELVLGQLARTDGGELRIVPLRTLNVTLVQGTRPLGSLYAARDLLPGRYRFAVLPRRPGGEELRAGLYALVVDVVSGDGRATRARLPFRVR